MKTKDYLKYYERLQTPYLKGKNVVLTGISSGIGQSTAEVLARLGAKQVLIYNSNTDGANKTMEMVEAAGGEAKLFQGDLGKYEVAVELAKVCKEYLGHVDALINNSGTHSPLTLLDTDEAAWQRIMDINLNSVYNVSRNIIPLMTEQKGAKVINNSSIVAKSGGMNGGTNYTTSKGGVSAFTRSLANHLAPYGMTVNTVSPGMTKTRLITWRTDEQMAESIENIPLKRVGYTEEIGTCIAFLLSSYADCITGYEMDINGGMFID
ncbi:MAG TPA: SDR family oxidoreductase [Clostridiaceae bacterium]|nr:SDR family oxidoreductase [Clostridiaceae bacterium]